MDGLRLNSFLNRDHNGLPFMLRRQYVHDIRTITIDLDDTLWEIMPVIVRAEKRLYEWYGENYPRIVEMFSRRDIMALRDEVVSENRAHLHDLTYLRCAVIAKLGKAAGYVNFPVDDAFAVFDDVRNDIELFTDVRPALTSLGQRYTLIAVTNGNANLDKIGISDLFDGFVSARTAGAAKPSREIFDAAVEAGGAAAGQTLHVGDDPHVDVIGAREA
ncbi:MAG: HAD family hydrolase, partial [Woeseiaceae bacterium]